MATRLMPHRFVLLLLTVCVLGVTTTAAAQIPAFPGADGAGGYATGGRGGIVYHVTKLNSALDDSEKNDFGTLRYGLNSSNFPTGVPRTIVFDVGGVFHLGRGDLSGYPEWDDNGNGWDAQSRLTIGGTQVTLAGQTAPGSGVIFMGGGLKPQGDNNIIRNITVASGYGLRNWWKPGDPFPDEPAPIESGVGVFPDATVYDAMDISGTNLMIDHVSTLYATDETISMNEVADNVTVQYSNISQGQNYPQWDAEGGGFTGHALGSLLEAGTGAAISFHHNLYAHQKSRMPQTQGDSAYYDFRNNVFYNWFGTAGVRRDATRINLVGNFYLSGNGGDDPIGRVNTGLSWENGGTNVLAGSSYCYREGNLLDTNKDGDANDGTDVSGGALSPLWSGGTETYAGTTDTATDAYDRVLDYVGANWWTRDGVIDTPDERIVNEVRTGTGQVVAWADNPWDDDPTEGTEWRALKNTPQSDRAVDWDTEASVGYGVGDGMPTYWELEHGLDPDARDDTGDFDNDGYTNLEEYLNDIAAWPAPNAITFNNAHADGRFAHILNWDANPDAGSVHPWQPSRYDTAVIDAGTVVVDAVGQHAGTLRLGSAPLDAPTLSIADGWLKVEDELIIGGDDAATANLSLSGGELTVPLLTKGANGSMSFTGGVLHADVVDFDLVNNGGTIAPGASPGLTYVTGDLVLNSGVLEIEIGGTGGGEFDQVFVDGVTTLGGTLSVKLIDLTGGESLFVPQLGDQFAFLASALGSDGMFDEYDYPELPAGLAWALSPGNMATFLTVVEAADLLGDYNDDGVVDAADYTVWRDTLGSTSDLRANGDDAGTSAGVIDEADYAVWKANFGTTAGAGSTPSLSAAVPEPASLVLLIGSLALLMVARPLQSHRVR